jgi:hypothetical protein
MLGWGHAGVRRRSPRADARTGIRASVSQNGRVPRSSASAAPRRHTAGPAPTRADLGALRPELVGRYDAELPGARAAVLARLVGALDRESLPGMVGRGPGWARFADGTEVHYPPAAAALFAPGAPGLAVELRRGPGDLSRDAPDLRRDPGAPDPALGHRRGPGAPDQTVQPGLSGPGAPHQTIRHRQDPGASGQTIPPGQDPGAAGEHRPGPGPDVGTGGRTSARVDDPAALVRLLWPGAALAAEVDNSVANLALARADRPTPELPDGHDLGRIEQLLTDGHPIHPCCRTRGGMTVADVLAYAPEHFPVIRLRRFRVPADRWYGTAPPLLYAHPWQAGRLRDRYPWLVDDGETGPVRPLMSLRTVAPVDGGPHVKTAVDVQMTSAVRTVSPAAVHNGPVLSRLLRRLTADLPIDVLAETGGGAVVVDGAPQRHLAFLRREAPVLHPGETAVPLAVLCASPMLLGRVHDPYDFLARLGDLLFSPLLELLRRGVALEAHGQNTLVVLRGAHPVRILYRDLGGVRVSPHRLGTAVDLVGDLPSDDPQVLRDKLTAAAFSTVAAELIDALARARGADPHRLWGIVAAAVRGYADARSILADPLPVKATTAMRLAADPLADRWARIDNPMAA